ncbi:MAG: CDP-glycerol glycerophosphotransferase family protein [Bacilli bacterium]|nr:CDP-glycerol glycerophosphotransferase family protein [Bacilli bacterium]MDD4406971.1 CDP-glycerol glycerophosphotransferase family protein [Bacilli bacterium]
MKKKEFLISVVIPIYNVGEYLNESINSVIKQTIGFKNIQLILVNDGSIDNSGEICEYYAKKYPDNIVYIKQKNAGVSAARNRGLLKVKAKYINFLDGDDKWDINAYEQGIKFLDENQIIDMVSFPMIKFGGKTGGHYLNYKFQNKMIISTVKNPDYIQNSISSTIIRTHQIKSQNLFFDERIKISEDMVFIYQLILPKLVYGTIDTANYNYRTRNDCSSAIDNSMYNPSWYNETLHIGWNKIIEESIKLYGYVIEYVQTFILYEYKWRINVSWNNSSLDKNKWENYLSDLKDFLKYVDDSTVFKMRFLSQKEKENYFLFKYGSSLFNKFRLKNEQILIDNNILLKFTDLNLFIDNIVAEEDRLILYGRDLLPIGHEKKDVYFVDNLGNKYLLDYYDVPQNLTYQNIHSDKIGFKVVIKLIKGLNAISAGISINNQHKKIKLKIINAASLRSSFSSLYIIRKKYILKYLNKEKKLVIYNNKFLKKLYLELKCTINLLKRKKFKSIIYRLLGKISKIFNLREVWIISDRIDAANDNGEAFFNYMMKFKKSLKRKVYFTISKESPDFKRLKKIGNVIDVNSIKYKIIFFKAKLIISSHIDTIVDNPFGKNSLYIKDLYPRYNVFLQHGIIKDDLSSWLNINSKKIDLFITSSKYEYDSLFDCKYNFERENVILTGLARYDKLERNNKNKEIIIMPTWRRSLASKIDQKTGKRSAIESFVNSQYFNIYNNLINNKRLLDALKKYGYKLRFVPHNNMQQYIKNFKKQKDVIFQYSNVNYSKLFSDSAILITDYSSVAFDFGYLRKPLLYFQFDKESFYKEQIYDIGYFDYEEMGLGPVEYNIDSLIDQIIKILKNDATLDSKYEKRINDFFAFNDSNNCERTYDKIIKLK